MSFNLHRLRKSYQGFQICCAITIFIFLLVGPLLILAGIVTCVVGADRTAHIVALGLMIIGFCLAFAVFGIARMINNEVSFSDSDSGDNQRVTSRQSRTTNPPQPLYPPQEQNRCAQPYPLQPPSYEEAVGISRPSIIRFN